MFKREAMNRAVSERSLLTWDWITEQINESFHYWLATTRVNGHPHVVPIAAIWHANALFFNLSTQSVKGQNIANQPHIAIHLESSINVVILEGEAQKAEQVLIQAHIINLYVQRYSFTPPIDNNEWYKLEPQRVLGWLLQNSYHTATRWVAAD